MGKYCSVCGVAVSQGLSGTIYYCGHTPKDNKGEIDE